ncbi:hypothetical protein [Streptomyces sp. NPDC048650]|uniref:hypothetical protein n=1 Tax=Streptomyces sp. NPDC048650 TaxID=3365583 RepID=UPI003713DCC5
MSAQEERSALISRPSLYAHALRLHRAEPDGHLPRRGYPLPEQPERTGALDQAESLVAVRDALVPLLTAPDTERAAAEVHLRLHELSVWDRHIRNAMATVPLVDETAARALGRRLTREGTSTAAVNAGLALLARVGEPEDVPYLRVLGLLRGFTRAVVAVLTALDRPAAALVWLTDRAEGRELRRLVEALAAGDDRAARTRLAEIPLDARATPPGTARRIAEAVGLADLLREEPAGSRVVAQAGRLLSRMTSQRDYLAEILNYGQAVAAYDALIPLAAQLPPTLDHYATLLSLALDLHSGPSALLDWRPGQREMLLEALESLLGTPSWAAVPDREPTDPLARRRAHWIRRTARQPFRRPASSAGLRITVTVRDPADAETVETRILIDGRPLVPEAFGRGPGNCPEYLLDSGRLRATAEPRQVQLAEAYCTEGCCGALYVTICREGGEVVWRDWRCPSPPKAPQPPLRLSEYRFDAAAYDAEVARAEQDTSWSWPARCTARRIAAGLRERPDLLARWDAQQGWIGTDFTDPDTTVVSFTFWPGLAAGRKRKDGPWLQFLWSLPDDGTPPEERATAALRRLATADPKTYAEVRGGSREYAEQLGFPWPQAR